MSLSVAGSEFDLQRYTALLEMADLVSRHHEPVELFRDLATPLSSVISLDFIDFSLYDPVNARMKSYAGADGTLASQSLDFPVEDSATGWVWQNQATLYIEDLSSEKRFEPAVHLLRENGLQSFLAFPLTTAHERLGALGFGSKKIQAFSSKDTEFLHRVAEMVALCIDNTLTRSSLMEERDRLRLLLQISAFHIQADQPQRVAAILKLIQDWAPRDYVGIYLYDAASKVLRLHTSDPQLTLKMAPRGKASLEETLAGQVFRSHEVEVRNYSDLVESSHQSVQRGLQLGVKSLCLIPLLGAKGPLGVLKVARRADHAFSARDVELLSQIAAAVVPVIESAETQKVLQHERRQMQALLGISNALASRDDLQQIFPRISTHLRRVLHQEYAACVVYDEQSGQLIRQAIDFPLGKGLLWDAGSRTDQNHSPAGTAFLARTPMIFSREEIEAFHSDFTTQLLQEGIKSFCCVPLDAPKGPLGSLNLGSTRDDAFHPDDFTLLRQVASQLALALENAKAVQQIEILKNGLAAEKLYLEDEISTEASFEEIVGDSHALKKVLAQAETVATSNATVLILGETGTGKELIARAIHRMSRRKERNFIKLNCAAIPTGLLESELFGHERGAFTGAIKQKIGRLELADQGTLFLDEVGEIPLEVQPKLLRVLQDHEFERLGGTRTIKVNLRLLAATNRDLTASIADGDFRSDLFYRLNVFPIALPPLRERREDIPNLIRHFVRKYARRMDRHIESMPAGTMNKLVNWDWPGNVRELENFIERSVILSERTTLRVPLNELIDEGEHAGDSAATLENVEREHILRALRESGGLISGPTGAARKLGLKRTTLQSMIVRLEITREEYSDPKKRK